jgi:uncharacterized membrane protein YfcA
LRAIILPVLSREKYSKHCIFGPAVPLVLTGAIAGTRVLIVGRVRTLRKVFAGLIVLLAVEMIFNGFTGKL